MLFQSKSSRQREGRGEMAKHAGNCCTRFPQHLVLLCSTRSSKTKQGNKTKDKRRRESLCCSITTRLAPSLLTIVICQERRVSRGAGSGEHEDIWCVWHSTLETSGVYLCLLCLMTEREQSSFIYVKVWHREKCSTARYNLAVQTQISP